MCIHTYIHVYIHIYIYIYTYSGTGSDLYHLSACCLAYTRTFVLAYSNLWHLFWHLCWHLSWQIFQQNSDMYSDKMSDAWRGPGEHRDSKSLGGATELQIYDSEYGSFRKTSEYQNPYVHCKALAIPGLPWHGGCWEQSCFRHLLWAAGKDHRCTRAGQASYVSIALGQPWILEGFLNHGNLPEKYPPVIELSYGKS